MNDLRKQVRTSLSILDSGGMGSVDNVIAALKAAGAIRGIHVGRKDMQDGTDECVEWFAGQILDILENNNWFAVNSLINCCDRFCPEIAP